MISLPGCNFRIFVFLASDFTILLTSAARWNVMHKTARPAEGARAKPHSNTPPAGCADGRKTAKRWLALAILQIPDRTSTPRGLN